MKPKIEAAARRGCAPPGRGHHQRTAAKILQAAYGSCTPRTVRNYVKRHPRLVEVIEETVELNLDTAERKLMTLIASGNLGAVIFYLKTKGKSRGYVERVEATGSGGGQIKIDIETVRNARQRNLELVEEVARRLAGGAAGAPAAGGAGESPQPDESDGGC